MNITIEVAGTIKWFDPVKGFGFIVPDDGTADVLLPAVHLRAGGFGAALTRGFGFLTRGDGPPDIFVHMITLRQCGINELKTHQPVLVRFGPGPKGLMATEVRLP